MEYGYTNAMLPLMWNFDARSYGMPADLRGGYASPGNFGGFNPFGNYSAMGMGNTFSDVMSLTSYVDSFTAQNKDLLALSKQYNDYQMQQRFAQTQQITAMRANLMAQGLNPNQVLNGGSQATSGFNQAIAAIQQLTGGNTAGGNANGTDNFVNLLLSLAQQYMGGGTAGTQPKATTEDSWDKYLADYRSAYGLDEAA